MQAADDFAELMEREYVPLLRAATVIIGDDGLAREVVQEAFTRALVRWRRVSKYDRPGAWVRLVTVRLALRAASRRQREAPVAPLPERAAPDDHPDLVLRAAIAALPDPDRAVVVLHYLCDLPIEEVARSIRAKPGTVRVRLHRARTKLAAVLALEVDDVRSS